MERMESHFWWMEMTFLDIPVFLAGFFTLVSGLGYVRRGIRLMHSAGHGDPQPPSQLLH